LIIDKPTENHEVDVELINRKYGIKMVINDFPMAYLCQAFAWPEGEYDQRIAFTPTHPFTSSELMFQSVLSCSSSECGMNSSTSHLDQIEQAIGKRNSGSLIAYAIDGELGLVVIVHRTVHKGDAVSIEANLVMATKQQQTNKRNQAQSSSSIPQISPSDMRLLKRNLRNVSLLNGVSIPCCQLLPSLSNHLSNITIEVVRTSPPSGFVKLSQGIFRNSNTSTSSSPNSGGGGGGGGGSQAVVIKTTEINVIRITSSTMITLTAIRDVVAPKENVDGEGSKYSHHLHHHSHHDQMKTVNVSEIADIEKDITHYEAEASSSIARKIDRALQQASRCAHDPILVKNKSPSIVLHSLIEMMLLPLWFRLLQLKQQHHQGIEDQGQGIVDKPTINLDLLPRGLLLSGPPGLLFHIYLPRIFILYVPFFRFISDVTINIDSIHSIPPHYSLFPSLSAQVLNMLLFIYIYND
jgi:hypothetical protein